MKRLINGIPFNEKTKRENYQVEVVNGFVQILIMETSNTVFSAQMKFKKRGNVFLTVTLTEAQFNEYVKDGAKDCSFSSKTAMYGVSDESVIHLYNMDLQVTKMEMKSYIAMQKAVKEFMEQRVS